MLKVNSDDVRDAAKAVKSVHTAVNKDVTSTHSVATQYLSANSGSMVDQQNESVQLMLAVTGAFADGLNDLHKTLGDAHKELTGKVATDRAAVATAVGGTIADPVNIVYDDSATVSAAVATAQGDANALVSSTNAAKLLVDALDNGGGEREKIRGTLLTLWSDCGSQGTAIGDVLTAWNAYARTAQGFDDTYAGRLSGTEIGKAPDWAGDIKSAGTVSGFFASWAKYTNEQISDKVDNQKKKSYRDSKHKSTTWLERLKDGDNLLSKFDSGFKNYLPWTYFGTSKKQYKHDARQSEFNKDKKTCKEGFSKDTTTRSKQGHHKGVIHRSTQSVGKVFGWAGKAAGAFGAAKNVWDVGSDGVHAFQSAKGDMKHKFGAAFHAGGKKATSVAVTTAVSGGAVALTDFAIGAAAAAGLIATGPFAPILVAGAEVAVSVGVSKLGWDSDAGNWAANKIWGK